MRKLIPFVIFLSLTSCSQYNHGFLSRSWHNINSKFNALLIAREDIDVANEYITKNYKENYEEVLPVYRIIDSTSLDTAKFYLIDAVKKASIIAEKHSNSKHLDEAYLLIGEARILKGEFENAIETLKYLNSISESESAKTVAMVQMMRAYIELGDLPNAEQLSGLVKNKSLDKNVRDIYLANMAYYHQARGEEAITAVLLEEAVKYMKKGNEKARFHFILGQLYGNLGKGTLSRKNYKLVKKNRGEYNLVFNANLGLLMTESLARNTNIEFDKMLEDRKNQDLKHKIYFKMGETARLKRNTNDAIGFFRKSVSESGSDLLGKGLAYKAIGDIYLDDLVDYEKAANYYDSTVITIPKEHLKKSDVVDRAQYLNEYIKYKKVYNLEDSLQRLASLDPAVLDQRLRNMVSQKYDEARKKHEEAQRQQAAAAIETQNQFSGKKWRLYDQSQKVKDKNDFIRVWGNRDLEDNWRRREKSSTTFVFSETERKMVETTVTPTALAQSEQKEVQKQAPLVINEEKAIEDEIKELKNRIPITKIQQIASKRKQEEASFIIARIYKLKFKDDKKARTAFLKFLEEFPKSNFEPEVLYYLALDESDTVNNPYAARLLSEYPNSSFGRQVRKGVMVMTQDKEVEAVKLYEKAFNLYDQKKYAESLSLLENGLNEYVGSQVEDKMAFLRLYSLAKIGSKDEYMVSLTDFMRAYPSSDLINKAKELLAIVK